MPSLLRPGTLEELTAELDHAESDLQALVAGLALDQLTEPPARGGWSIAECLEHLRITTEAFLPLLGEAVDGLPSIQGGPMTYRLDPAGAVLVWLMEPPSRMPTNTPEAFAPRRGDLVEGFADRFSASQDRLREFIEGCHGLRLTRATIVSPFNASVRYSVYAALRILAAHQRRHLWQAHRVREQISPA
jgi:hypothetical protein